LERSGHWIGSWLTVGHREKCDRKVFLNYWCAPLPPGRYTVQALYRPRSIAGNAAEDWPPTASKRVTFDIQPTTSTKLEVRISRLTDQAAKGDQLAIDFLGFTGDHAACAPLLEAAYQDDEFVQNRAVVALSFLPDPSTLLDAAVAKVREQGPTPALAHWLSFTGAPVETIAPLYFRWLAATGVRARLGAVTGLRLLAGNAMADQKRIRTAMQTALVDAEPRVRSEAITALATDPDDEFVTTLKRLSRQDPAAGVRQLAATALRDIGLKTDSARPVTQ
jgi:hypothetical protein